MNDLSVSVALAQVFIINYVTGFWKTNQIVTLPFYWLS